MCIHVSQTVLYILGLSLPWLNPADLTISILMYLVPQSLFVGNIFSVTVTNSNVGLPKANSAICTLYCRGGKISRYSGLIWLFWNYGENKVNKESHRDAK